MFGWRNETRMGNIYKKAVSCHRVVFEWVNRLRKAYGAIPYRKAVSMDQHAVRYMDQQHFVI